MEKRRYFHYMIATFLKTRFRFNLDKKAIYLIFNQFSKVSINLDKEETQWSRKKTRISSLIGNAKSDDG